MNQVHGAARAELYYVQLVHLRPHHSDIPTSASKFHGEIVNCHGGPPINCSIARHHPMQYAIYW